MLLTGLALACAACSQEDAPAEKVAEAAEQIVAPTPEPVMAAQGEWAPQDTCGKIDGAAAFRQMLAAAVKARDADVLAALAATDVKLDFGGGEGRAELHRRLTGDGAGLWDELDALLALGCSANDLGGITIPWYFDQDMGSADPFETWLVTGENVPVLASLDTAGEAIERVSWDIVTVDEFDPEAAFQAVTLADGTEGFIASGKMRSVIDYRLVASSRNGRWRITSLVAGD